MPHSSLLEKLQTLFRQHNITGLSTDSRSIKENEAFFAIKGENYDGNKFILDALNRKAELIISDNEESIKLNPGKIIYVEDARIALSLAAKIFYPKEPLHLIAVTGTNGKSSVVSYIAQLYSLLGGNAATIGTLGVQCFSNIELPKISEILTTPDPINFRKIAHNLAKNNIKYLAFEASSHGLDQERLYDVKASVACFTSFSQDHLDYHHTKDAYLLAKLKLFTNNLLPSGFAILNSDIAEIDFIKNYLNRYNVKFITIGQEGDLKINKTVSSIHGQNINFTFNNKDYKFNTEIIGSFQASNLLIAAIVVHNTGFALDKVISLLSKIKSVKGRMQRVYSNDLDNWNVKQEMSKRSVVSLHEYANSPKFCEANFSKQKSINVFIDYAHTPDALEKALNELKNIKLKGSKLIVVFGCGGNRDKSKRSLMGEIAAKIADNIIITDDNPRNENPSDIRKEVISGMNKANYIEIADREEAIKYGINNLGKEDILLIAGKGHENYQIIGDKKISFDDAEIARKFL